MKKNWGNSDNKSKQSPKQEIKVKFFAECVEAGGVNKYSVDVFVWKGENFAPKNFPVLLIIKSGGKEKMQQASIGDCGKAIFPVEVGSGSVKISAIVGGQDFDYQQELIAPAPKTKEIKKVEPRPEKPKVEFVPGGGFLKNFDANQGRK